ncbi:MAG: methionyl-tRNA formyltransferase [Bacteroides sp.]|nr:methionyl-tRNA formyltransferase [Bacteroides sp.]MCM1548538.1 methionyl-tRNA formyltransferase [Clostridium sp.]
MRIIFMGTPEFAVKVLEAIVTAGHEVAGVYTQPDKPKGRGKSMQYTPVKEKALEYNIPVFQPEQVRNPEVIEEMKKLEPEAIVVVAFGQILPEAILKLPPLGCINVHASLLPKYRGAAPIQRVIIDGEKESGVTTMYMAKGLDTGDMIEKKVVPIEPKETGGTYHDKLAAAGAELCLSTLQKLAEGTAPRIPQEDARSCYAHMLNKAMGELDFQKPAEELERLIRGLNPWPSAYTRLEGKTLKIYEADVVETEPADGKSVSAGTVIAVDKKSFTVQCNPGALRITSLQLEGKKRMETAAFLLGYRMTAGMELG